LSVVDIWALNPMIPSLFLPFISPFLFSPLFSSLPVFNVGSTCCQVGQFGAVTFVLGFLSPASTYHVVLTFLSPRFSGRSFSCAFYFADPPFPPFIASITPRAARLILSRSGFSPRVGPFLLPPPPPPRVAPAAFQLRFRPLPLVFGMIVQKSFLFCCSADAEFIEV